MFILAPSYCQPNNRLFVLIQEERKSRAGASPMPNMSSRKLVLLLLNSLSLRVTRTYYAHYWYVVTVAMLSTTSSSSSRICVLFFFYVEVSLGIRATSLLAHYYFLGSLYTKLLYNYLLYYMQYSSFYAQKLYDVS